jgi:hypothetical protein
MRTRCRISVHSSSSLASTVAPASAFVLAYCLHPRGKTQKLCITQLKKQYAVSLWFRAPAQRQDAEALLCRTPPLPPMQARPWEEACPQDLHGVRGGEIRLAAIAGYVCTAGMCPPKVAPGRCTRQHGEAIPFNTISKLLDNATTTILSSFLSSCIQY